MEVDQGDDMISVTLPYENDEMQSIQTDGAVVDMAKVHFPPQIALEQYPRTSLIYLRNTGFDKVELLFGNCDLETRNKYLVEYISGDIVHGIKELTETWKSIINHFNGLESPEASCSILNESETSEFIASHLELVSQIDSFLKSLFLLVLMRLKSSSDINFDTKHSVASFNKNAY